MPTSDAVPTPPSAVSAGQPPTSEHDPVRSAAPPGADERTVSNPVAQPAT